MNNNQEFIISKRYCHVCNCCNHCIETCIMQHNFTYNDINDNDIWNRMLELSRDNNNNNNNNNNNYNNNKTNNNNTINNTFYLNNYVYYDRNEDYLDDFNLSIPLQQQFLLYEFKKKYL